MKRNTRAMLKPISARLSTSSPGSFLFFSRHIGKWEDIGDELARSCVSLVAFYVTKKHSSLLIDLSIPFTTAKLAGWAWGMTSTIWSTSGSMEANLTTATWTVKSRHATAANIELSWITMGKESGFPTIIEIICGGIRSARSKQTI